jgi:hypothetical protein
MSLFKTLNRFKHWAVSIWGNFKAIEGGDLIPTALSSIVLAIATTIEIAGNGAIASLAEEFPLRNASQH